MNKRSVFSNDGVDIAQPQPVEVIKEDVKTVGEKEQEVVKETVKQTIKKEKPIVKEIKQNKLIVGKKEFLIKSGYKFYTINANVKIGDDKFNIQRVVQEKSEKLANIEYDRIIKKEFGKPKSVTGRTIKKYQDGDMEFMNVNVEKKAPERQKTQEEIDLEKKIELLTTDIMGVFKVTLSTKYVTAQSSTQYILAPSKEGVYAQLDLIEERDQGSNEGILSDSVKQIIKMTSNAIKMDKGCLKYLSKHSVEDIQELYDKTTKYEKERISRAVEIYKRLQEKGFRLFGGHFKVNNTTLTLLEMARNEEESTTLMLGEDRARELAMRSKNNAEIKHRAAIIEEDIKEHFEKNQDSYNISFEEHIVNTIKDMTKQEDTIYKTLFEVQDIDKYIKIVDEGNVIRAKVNDGTIEDYINDKMEGKMKDICKELKTAFEKKGAQASFKDGILEVIRSKPRR